MKGDWFGLKCWYSRYLLLSTVERESLVSQETRTDALYNDNVFTGQTFIQTWDSNLQTRPLQGAALPLSVFKRPRRSQSPGTRTPLLLSGGGEIIILMPPDSFHCVKAVKR